MDVYPLLNLDICRHKGLTIIVFLVVNLHEKINTVTQYIITWQFALSSTI